MKKGAEAPFANPAYAELEGVTNANLDALLEDTTKGRASSDAGDAVASVATAIGGVAYTAHAIIRIVDERVGAI